MSDTPNTTPVTPPTIPVQPVINVNVTPTVPNKSWWKILLGVLAGIAIAVLAAMGLKKTEETAKDNIKDKPEIIINTKFENGGKDDSHDSDPDMKPTLDKFIIISLLMLASSLFGTNTNEVKFQDIYNKMTTNTVSYDEIRNMATRYVMISKYSKMEYIYPEFIITINNDKTYSVSNIIDNFKIKYIYDTNKFDSFTYNVKPIVKIQYTNEANKVSNLFTPELGVFFALDISYDRETNMFYQYALLGYKFKLPFGFGIEPCVGFNFNTGIDLFLVGTYNLFNMFDVGVSFQVIKTSGGIAMGKSF